jgi:hypothetical protein
VTLDSHSKKTTSKSSFHREGFILKIEILSVGMKIIMLNKFLSKGAGNPEVEQC